MAVAGFRERARRHQIKFRENVLKVGYNDSEIILKDDDAQKGIIFFDGFKVYEEAQDRYPHYKLNQACFANMLRSEHIPFNFFVPVSRKPEYARAILNRFLGGTINTINEIKIDYAPNPGNALLDKTSFDVFLDYRHISGGKGILGFEVMYTEGAYKLMKRSREGREVNDQTSVYYSLTNKTGIYKMDSIEKLKTDEFRQVWRNQLLGESMTTKNNPDSRYEHFTSVILYPEGNDHLRELIPKYKSLLNPGCESSFAGITYEEFISTARQHTADAEFLRWLQYLEDRYIVKI